MRRKRMASASVPVCVGITQEADKAIRLCIESSLCLRNLRLQSTAGPPAPSDLGARNEIRNSRACGGPRIVRWRLFSAVFPKAEEYLHFECVMSIGSHRAGLKSSR